jgi:hypothetical protein
MSTDFVVIARKMATSTRQVCFCSGTPFLGSGMDVGFVIA